ncbi:hypothetical protein SAMN04487943_11530 [Gracilibacillus orientalis]|uniref:Uncharacterized protein n=1 Tax=Gracilibacillus orientalis TaxID=334253 RepID=A0A1I4Q8X9_9BACI|nr:hypothetical protein [Gracilibacillus orientalis]SFM36552.1 hypothetical protein SAMN04487943_11530 [Gracilibacillus orientalis]
MDQSQLQECITECESALSHLNNAMSKAHEQAKQKMQHASKDLEECIAECRELL